MIKPPDHEKYQFEVITPEVQAQLPYSEEGYEPEFDPASPERRVLAHITDEVDAAAGGVPRNTPEALARVLAISPDSPQFDPDPDLALVEVEGAVDGLTEAGLVESHKDGSLHLTKAGYTELYN